MLAPFTSLSSAMSRQSGDSTEDGTISPSSRKTPGYVCVCEDKSLRTIVWFIHTIQCATNDPHEELRFIVILSFAFLVNQEGKKN